MVSSTLTYRTLLASSAQCVHCTVGYPCSIFTPVYDTGVYFAANYTPVADTGV